MTTKQLQQLEEKIRELVPESFKFKNGKIPYPITLEHCMEALSRTVNAKSSIQEMAAWEFARNQVFMTWHFLQPWEDQEEAHTFLASYLLQ